METYRLDGFPPECSTIRIAYFKQVTNAAELRTRLIKAATAAGPEGDRERDILDFAFIDADLVYSRQHLLAAVYQALLAQTQNRLLTKTVHSEILLALSPASNISEAIKVFGISPASKNVLLVRIRSAQPAEADALALSAVDSLVHGTLVSVDDLSSDADWPRVRKVYKLHDLPPMDGWTEEARRHVVEPVLISAVATKSVAG